MESKIAIVTGAVGIIGPGVCKSLAEAGWKVVAHAQTKEDWERYEKITGEPVPAELRLEGDLTTQVACCDLSDHVHERLGPVSLIVNNAAVNPVPFPEWGNITEEYALQVLRVNLLAPLFLVQAFLKDLKVAAGGTVVNIGSIHSEIPMPGQILYPVAKAGLDKLTRIMARDFAAFRIRSNMIRLGSVPGVAFMWETLCDLSEEKARQLYREILPRHLNEQAAVSPSGEVVTPADVGQLVAFLASEAAAHINGAIIPLDSALSSVVQFPIKSTSWNPVEAVEKWLEAHRS